MFRKTSKLESLAAIKERLSLDNSKSGRKTVKVYSPGKEDGEVKYEVDLTDVLENRTELAYREACENRRFEIQMYWHRAAYFWVFIVSIYTAFFLICDNEKSIPYENVAKLALAFLGFVFCLGFYFSNKGSKAWQENWEIHEGLLEDEVAVKLYKTFHYDEANDYSVSKINDVLCATLSLFSFAFFIAILALSIQNWFKDFPFALKVFLFVFTIFTVLLFLHIAKKHVCGNPFESKELKFKKAEYL